MGGVRTELQAPVLLVSYSCFELMDTLSVTLQNATPFYK